MISLPTKLRPRSERNSKAMHAPSAVQYVVILVGLFTILTATNRSVADVIIMHAGDKSPLDEDWTLDHISGSDPMDQSNPQTMPILDSNDIKAWHINTNSSAFVFQKTGDGFDLDDFSGSMWKLSALISITELNDRLDLGLMMDVYILNNSEGERVDHYYRLLFGSESDGDALISLDGSDRRTPHIIAGSGYHLYEMIARPDEHADGGVLISLYVDGVLLEDDYFGTHNRIQDTDQIRFGGLQRGTSGGTANFAFVQFEVGDDLTPGIPEPTTALLFAPVAMAITRRRQTI